jgi:hypothetical protein
LVRFFQLGSVFIKKSNQTGFFFFFFKKRTGTGSDRPVSVQFISVILEQKPVQTGLAWFFQSGSVFLWFGSVWLGFFVLDLVLFGLVFSVSDL